MVRLESFAKNRDVAFKIVSLRPKSHLIIPYRYWTQKILGEQTHSSELQLVFVNHSQQIVLYRQNVRLCNTFSRLSSVRIRLVRIRLNSQRSSSDKAYIFPS